MNAELEKQISDIVTKIKNNEEFEPLILSKNQIEEDEIDETFARLGIVNQNQYISWSRWPDEELRLNLFNSHGTYLLVKIVQGDCCGGNCGCK